MHFLHLFLSSNMYYEMYHSWKRAMDLLKERKAKKGGSGGSCQGGGQSQVVCNQVPIRVKRLDKKSRGVNRSFCWSLVVTGLFKGAPHTCKPLRLPQNDKVPSVSS